ncbi:hypothetical protein [Planobispora longispora]|uniref:Uncharacterized protein n=1 Tax=Planobispora longispora TaxID=28887 RepID=A0A8J3W897_9ACTN|nr:hypothetical protein [Planobispora longispora]BFE85540.1 hypothetical protein GCM10020093_081410 [Planobispora longispora]GIH80419.1 hypothetical protein Plo01_68480 [Planobispora longispora]
MHFHGINGVSRVKIWILHQIDRADRELCMDQDEWAYRLGWTVKENGFGARSYHNPLFDLQKAERIYSEACAESVSGNAAA